MAAVREPVWKRTLKHLAFLIALLVIALTGNGCASTPWPEEWAPGVPATAAQERSERVSPRRYEQAGTPVYDASECVGAVVNGVCHGPVVPRGGYTPRCYGTMVSGICHGSLH